MNHITADYKIFSESGAELSRIPWDETIDIHDHKRILYTFCNRRQRLIQR